MSSVDIWFEYKAYVEYGKKIIINYLLKITERAVADYLVFLSLHFLERLRKTIKVLDRRADNAVEIQSRYPLNACLVHYCYCDLVDTKAYT
jgi:hypothetical protein